MHELLVLLAHGSSDSRWRAPFEQLLQDMKAKLGSNSVALAYMEFCQPTLKEIVSIAYEQEVRTITILPLFLAGGAHLAKDIPKQVKEMEAQFQDLTLEVLPPLGEHPEMMLLMRKLIADTMPSMAVK